MFAVAHPRDRQSQAQVHPTLQKSVCHTGHSDGTALASLRKPGLVLSLVEPYGADNLASMLTEKF